jgi:FSR family fosmidomycin resistance protein-like MFS transporter
VAEGAAVLAAELGASVLDDRARARRDVRVITAVATAHGLSHFFQLVLPPLFPLLTAEFGVGYTAIGLMLTCSFAASGIGQPVSGFLVDRFGALRVLVAGLLLVAGAVGAAGLATSYWMLLPIAVLAGCGNSVFHPSDYAILNSRVHARRLGRAYSAHGIAGNIGWMTAPLVVGGLASATSWRVALLAVSALGVGAALVLATRGRLLGGRERGATPVAAATRRSLRADVELLLQRPILLAFAFFALLAMSMIGLQSFSVAAMVQLHHVPLAAAGGALTAFLLGGAAGVLAGGTLADRTRRHDLVAGGGLLVAACLAALLGAGPLAHHALVALMALTGFALGVTQPSRDLLVRAATPPGASGKVYGFVYSGLDLGSLATPVIYGWLLDHGAARVVFLASAVLMVCTIATVTQVRRVAQPAPVAA